MTIEQSLKVLIIGLNSDIAKMMSSLFIKDGWEVQGTSRTSQDLETNRKLVYLDIIDDNSFSAQLNNLYNQIDEWDALIFAAGSMNPIGNFFEVEFESVKKSIFLNLVGPMQILHKVWDKRRLNSRCNVFFFAGGGTNNPFDNYLTYALSKVSCIKLVELLSSEFPSAGFFAIGTGYVRTKIHQETTEAGLSAGSNLAKTLDLLKTEGTPVKHIYDVVHWCMKNSEIASGRNFSVRDDFKSFAEDQVAISSLLASREDAFKLRRKLNSWRSESD